MGILDKYFAAKGSTAGKVKDVWANVPARAQTKEGDITADISATSGTGINAFDGDPRGKSDTTADDLQQGFVPKTLTPSAYPSSAEGLNGTTAIPETTAKLGNSQWYGSALGYAFRAPKTGISSLYDFFKGKGAKVAGTIFHNYTPEATNTYESKLPDAVKARAKSDTAISTPSTS